jgi:hypothetical protein
MRSAAISSLSPSALFSTFILHVETTVISDLTVGGVQGGAIFFL